MKTASEVPNITRTAWWLTFMAMGGGMYTARWIYESGLSFWLKRADITYTASALLIAIVASAIFAVGCVGRMKDMNASVSVARMVFLFPVWLILMGTVPSASSENPEPLLRFLRWARRLAVGAGALFVGAAIVFAFASKTRSPTDGPSADAAGLIPTASATFQNNDPAGSQQLSFEGCLELIRRTSQELGVAPLNIVETTDMRVVKYITIDGSVLVTCDRATGKALITRHGS